MEWDYCKQPIYRGNNTNKNHNPYTTNNISEL